MSQLVVGVNASIANAGSAKNVKVTVHVPILLFLVLVCAARRTETVEGNLTSKVEKTLSTL